MPGAACLPVTGPAGTLTAMLICMAVTLVIRSLCLYSPATAAQTIDRSDALNLPKLVPFSQELARVRIHTEIETLMFPHIRITYEPGRFSTRKPSSFGNDRCAPPRRVKFRLNALDA